jgi:ribosome inactivating protein
MADFVVSLRQHEYQASLGALRTYLENLRHGYLDIELKLPTADTPVHLQLRCSDAYVIGFKGQDSWYHFENEEVAGDAASVLAATTMSSPMSRR